MIISRDRDTAIDRRCDRHFRQTVRVVVAFSKKIYVSRPKTTNLGQIVDCWVPLILFRY